MSKLGINTGSTPNDGTGDSLLLGATKINKNFDELYNFLGDGTSLSGVVTSLTAGDNISLSGSTDDVTISVSGVVTSLTAGDNISLSGSTGNVTITGQASGANVTISDNPPSSANSGDLWWESDAGRLKVYYSDVWVDSNPAGGNSGGGGGGISGINIQDEGSVLSTTATALNFVGNGVVASGTGSTKTITISGGSGITTANINADTLQVSGVSTFTSDVVLNANLDLQDGDKILLGTGDDLEIYHSGSHSFIVDSGVGSLYVRASAGNIQDQGNANQSWLQFNSGAGVEAYFAGNKKLETTNTGINITGHTETDTLNVSGTSTFNNPVDINGTLNVSGVSTFNNPIDINGTFDFSTTGTFNGNIDIKAHVEFDGSPGSSSLFMYDDNAIYFGSHNDGAIVYNNADNRIKFSRTGAGEIEINAEPVTLKHSNSTKLTTTGAGVSVTGIVTATSAIIGAGSSTNGIQSPALTLSHNNPTVVGTAGTLGEFKQIGGQPYFYDGTQWRALFLIDGVESANVADTDWDNTMIRINFDQATIGDVTNLKDGRTPSASQVDLVSSPVKYGTKSGRWQTNNSGLTFSQNNSGSIYYPFEGAWTIEGWFYFDPSQLPNSNTISNSTILFSNYHPTVGVFKNWMVGLRYSGITSTYNFYWYNKNSSNTNSGEAGNSQSGFMLGQYTTSYFADSAWHHIALVRDSSNGSIHFYLDGTEHGSTASNQLVELEISDDANHIFGLGYYGESGYYKRFLGNIDDVRISKIARYTGNFTPPTTALPITGTTTTVVQPPDSKIGEVVLGNSPAWTGTPGVTPTRVGAGHYRTTFATSYSNATDYTIQTNMNDHIPSTTPVGIGVTRYAGYADFIVTRVSDSVGIDSGSLAINLIKK